MKKRITLEEKVEYYNALLNENPKITRDETIEWFHSNGYCFDKDNYTQVRNKLSVQRYKRER